MKLPQLTARRLQGNNGGHPAYALLLSLPPLLLLELPVEFLLCAAPEADAEEDDAPPDEEEEAASSSAALFNSA